MNLALKKSKETNMLQYIEDLLLVSKYAAVYVEAEDENEQDLVHVVYPENEECPKTDSNYYFVKDDNFKDHIFVCNRTVIRDVFSVNESLDEDTILEWLEAYNILLNEGSLILVNGDICYRCVTIIEDELKSEETLEQLIHAISTENAYVEAVGKALENTVKGE